MQLRQSKKRHIILAASLIAVAPVWTCTVSAQPLPGSATIQPGSLSRPELGMQSGPVIPPRLTGEQAEVFKKNIAAYQQCTREKAGGMRLFEAADNITHLRDCRQYWESLLSDNAKRKYPNANLPPPGGYEQMSANGFAEYRSLGGAGRTGPREC